MSNDRREFMQLSLAAAAMLATGSCASAQTLRERSAPPSKKLKILVMGGTKFIGPALVEQARANGHTLTLFNRGKTNTELFPDIERIEGDRDPKKGKGLSGLDGRTFDVVFNDIGFYPRHVAASAEQFAKNNGGHYIFISSISCYAKNDVEGADETAELARMEDPTLESMGKNGEHYGALKVLCEEAAEKAMPGKTTIIRPGYIVGPGDDSDRFTYWPVRFDQGGKVLVPGAASDPLQVIDVRDLSAFMLRCAEQKTIGVFNACGPEKKLPWGDVINACKKSSSAKDVEAVWIPADKLAEHKDVEFPIWAPYAGETKGFHTVSNARGVAAGLKFRPIETIVADTLAWWKTLPAERRERIKKQFDAQKEADLIASLAK